MSIITVTVQANEKNMRTVSTQKGDKQVISAPIIKDGTGKWVYASAFVNFQVNQGDILTISGRVEQKQDGEYHNNNFVFPTVEKVFIPDDNSKQSQAKQDLFGGSEPIEVKTEDLPF